MKYTLNATAPTYPSCLLTIFTNLLSFILYVCECFACMYANLNCGTFSQKNITQQQQNHLDIEGSWGNEKTRGKDTCHQLDNSSSIPKTHTVEGKN